MEILRTGLRTWTTKGGRLRSVIVTPKDVESAKKRLAFENVVVSLANEKSISPWFANSLVRILRKNKRRTRKQKLAYRLNYEPSFFNSTRKSLIAELNVLAKVQDRVWSCLEDDGKKKVLEMAKTRIGLLKNI